MIGPNTIEDRIDWAETVSELEILVIQCKAREDRAAESVPIHSGSPTMGDHRYWVEHRLKAERLLRELKVSIQYNSKE